MQKDNNLLSDLDGNFLKLCPDNFLHSGQSKSYSKAFAIYCNLDHAHVLIGYHPSMSVSDMARDIKSNSSQFINMKKWIMGKFYWQDGFGAFTYSKSQIDDVAKYILNQPEHHKKRSFREEFTPNGARVGNPRVLQIMIHITVLSIIKYPYFTTLSLTSIGTA